MDKNPKVVVRKKNVTFFKEIASTIKWESLEGASLFYSPYNVGHNPWCHLRFA